MHLENAEQQQFLDYPKHQMPVRYFGVPTPVEQHAATSGPSFHNSTKKTTLITQQGQLCDENDTRRELSQIRSDVRSKAAMFDSEALRNEQRSSEQQQQVCFRGINASAFKNFSTPKN